MSQVRGTFPASRPAVQGAAAAAVAAVATLSLVVAGCGQPAPQPLQPEAFLTRRQVDGTGRAQPVDQSGALVVGTVNPEPLTPPPGGNPRVAAVVAEGVKPGTDTAQANTVDISNPVPSTGPTIGQAPPAPGNNADGGYQLVGTVLAEVNGTPIYADKVLEILEKPLAAEARKQRTEAEFKAVAAQLVREQVAALVNAELEYAIAQRVLGTQEQAMARAQTVQWRIEQVAAAGGSEELARKKWAAEGYDFKRAQEEYRTSMRRLYYQKKEWPRIQVRQSDIRSYYEATKNTEFTTQSAARFRVIKIDFARSGGEQAALDKGKDIEKHARGGEDFAKLAETRNDEPLYSQPFPQPFAKGAFAVEAVEDAVWKINNGEITPLIKTKDAYYLAMLEKKEVGRTIPFEEAQDAIATKLRKQQFAMLQARVRQRLFDEARGGYKEHPQMMEVAMDMIMQRYPTWRAGGPVSVR